MREAKVKRVFLKIMEKSLRSAQLEAVISMLNLNRPRQATTGDALSQLLSDDTTWKVLVYDQLGQEVIAPLLRVADLRENGVTVHMYYYLLLTTTTMI